MIFGCSNSANEQNNPSSGEITKRILDEKIPEWLKSYNVPSIAIGNIIDGKLKWTEVYGEQKPGTKANDSTLYTIASLTKPITAELVLRLVDKGKISLDEPLSDYWIDPDVIKDRRHKLLTPRIALSHQTGFPNWRGQEGENGVLTFKFTPGEKFQYSGEGYDYLGRFVEKKMNQSLEALAEQYLFKPLKMHNTTYSYREWIEGRVAYPQDVEGNVRKPDVMKKGKWSGGNHLITSIDDYSRFLVNVMNKKDISVNLANQRDSINSLIGDFIAIKHDTIHLNAKHRGWGLGWMIEEFDHEKVIWHTGGGWGVSCLALYYPNTKNGVVILTNGGNGFNLIIEVLDVIYGKTEFNQYFRGFLNESN